MSTSQPIQTQHEFQAFINGIDIETPFKHLQQNYGYDNRYIQQQIANSDTFAKIRQESGNDPLSGGNRGEVIKKQKIKLKDGSIRTVRMDGKKKYVIYNKERFYLSNENKGKYKYV